MVKTLPLLGIVMSVIHFAFHMTYGKKRKDDVEKIENFKSGEPEDCARNAANQDGCANEWMEKNCKQTCEYANKVYGQRPPGISIFEEAFGIGILQQKGIGFVLKTTIWWLVCISILEIYLGRAVTIVCLVVAAVMQMAVPVLKQRIMKPGQKYISVGLVECCGSLFNWQLVGAALATLAFRLENKRLRMIAAAAVPLTYAGNVLNDYRSSEYKGLRNDSPRFIFVWHAASYFIGVLWGGLASYQRN